MKDADITGKGQSRRHLFIGLVGLVLFSSACAVGPKYRRPDAPVPPAYKEASPGSFKEAANWKEAEPNDGATRGKWWEVYQDPELNALEEQVNISNQNILLAEAQFRQARDVVRIARSNLFPTVVASPSIVNSRAAITPLRSASSNLLPASRTTYSLPVDLSWEADIWGSIRGSVRGTANAAQATFAQLENARLVFQSELAQNYFRLHGTDGVRELLERTVKSYEEYLQLTKDRFASGVASGADVAQAQTQLNTARVQLIDLQESRAQFEHAIAILIGKPPSGLSISSTPIKYSPPPVPVGLPSNLLERRPDIAAAERQMAAANEQIGIAKAAYFPRLLLSAAVGFESTRFTEWFTWPSRFWSIGPQLTETLFDAGKRHAQLDLAQAAYDATVASYRQTVLTGFQQVEDNLASLRILEDEARAQDEALQAARQTLEISTYQYKAGVTSYLQVIVSQAVALQNETEALNILTRRMLANVLLIEALGGGWDSSLLPKTESLISKK